MAGIISGMDTESIVKELMAAESSKRTKIEQSKTKLEWKMEKWDEMNKKIYSLYTDKLSKMKLQGSYQTRKVSSSSETKVTATATSQAANGSYSLKINQLAAAQYITGASLKDKDLKANSTLVSAGMEAGTEITIRTGADLDQITTLEIEEDTTIASLVKSLKDAGLNANFDVNQGRFFISAGNSGEDNRFTITTKELTAVEEAARDDIMTALDYDNLSTDNKKKVNNALYALQNGSLEEMTKAEESLDTILKETGRESYQSSLSNGIAMLKNATPGDGAEAGKGLDALGLQEITEEIAKNGYDAGGMTVIAAKDSEVVLNGAVMKNATNTVIVNGLTMQLTGVTTAEETVNLSVSNDTDAIYNMIKDFVKSYNELLTGMSEGYYAKSSKGYEPLTEDEKTAMSDKQVELWEKKIKDSLLRRDNTLNSTASAMRSALQTTVEVDGKSYSLASLGIVTGDYTERGLLHIQGDAEDKEFSDKENKLKELLANDPEKVTTILSGVSTKLYDTLTDKLKFSTMSSAMTVYNDKQMKKQVETYEKQMKEWDKRLIEMENRYYKQFTAMEKAIQSTQSQQSSMAGFFGS